MESNASEYVWLSKRQKPYDLSHFNALAVMIVNAHHKVWKCEFHFHLIKRQPHWSWMRLKRTGAALCPKAPLCEETNTDATTPKARLVTARLHFMRFQTTWNKLMFAFTALERRWHWTEEQGETCDLSERGWSDFCGRTVYAYWGKAGATVISYQGVEM